MFIEKGKLHHNDHQLVEWNAQYFHRTTNIYISSADFINNTLTTDTNLNLLLGPYTVQDAKTETI